MYAPVQQETTRHLFQISDVLTWLFKMFESKNGSRKFDEKLVIYKLQYLANEKYLHSVK